MPSFPIPSDLPLGAEWVKQAPQNGVVPTPNEPYQPVKLIQTQGQVLSWLYAEITRPGLKYGTGTNQIVRDWVKEVGRPNDQAGHVVARTGGGSGEKTWNIFPQDPNINMGTYNRTYEWILRKEINCGTSKIWYRFNFDDPDFPSRATSFNLFAIYASGGTINITLVNSH